MAVIELPFIGSIAVYDFSTTIENATYTFLVQWNYRENSWYINVTDSGGSILINSIKLCLGAFLGRVVPSAPFTSGIFVAVDTAGGSQEAGFDDLGSRVVVKYVAASDLFALQQLAVSITPND